MKTFEDLVDITSKLRSDNGCPWDREQTHDSLMKCLREECEEVIAAVENGDMENLCEELGDVMFLLVLNGQISDENGSFTMNDVIDGICEKMIRRHPHVFGDVKVNSAAEGQALWNEIKLQEKLKKAL